MRLSRQDVIPWLWVVAITALLLLPLPLGVAARRWPQLMRELTDFGHPLAFAWLAHVVFRSLRLRVPAPSWRPYLWVLGGAVVYGAATEYVQGFVDRQPSLPDFRNDMLGAAIALLLHARGELRSAGPRLALAMAATGLGVLAVAPLAFTIAAYAHRQLAAPVLWQADSALFDHLSRWQREGQTSLSMREPLVDWNGYGYLEIDVSNPQGAPHPVVVRVHDIHHDNRHEDRYNRRFTLPPQSRQTLRIPLEEIRAGPEGRELDMGAIRGFVVFSVSRVSGASFDVSQVRLAR